jgi:hypothetical protein
MCKCFRTSSRISGGGAALLEGSGELYAYQKYVSGAFLPAHTPLNRRSFGRQVGIAERRRRRSRDRQLNRGIGDELSGRGDEGPGGANIEGFR